MPTHIVIPKGTELHRFPLDALICVSADGNYSNVMTLDGRETLVCLQLGQIEDLMAKQLGSGIRNFVRLGRGLQAEADYVRLPGTSKRTVCIPGCPDQTQGPHGADIKRSS